MPTWKEAIRNDSQPINEILSDSGELALELPGEVWEGIEKFGVDAYNTLNSVKFAWEATPEEINSARQIYRIKDVLNFPNNTRAISIDEIKASIDNFSNSYLAKSNARIKNYIDKTKKTINALQVSNKLIETYRVVKPIVKKAVNIGGLVFNFANSSEIAQDVLQYILREVQRRYGKEIEQYWNNFVSSPVFIITGNGNEENAELILGKYAEIEEAYMDEVNKILLDISDSLDGFLSLVRTLNDSIIGRESEFTIRNFETISNNTINDVDTYNEWNYLAIKDVGIVRIKQDEEEIILEDVEAINVLKTSDDLYFTVYDELLDKTELYRTSNTTSAITICDGRSLGIYNVFDRIMIVTNKQISDTTTAYLTYSVSEIIASEVINGFLYYSVNNKLSHFESLPSSPIEDTTVNGTIYSIKEYNDSIFIGSVYNGEIEISSYVQQPEFLEKESDIKGFTFLKEIGGTIYGVKNNDIYTISKDLTTDEITSTLICDNIDAEINGLEIVNISGTDYFIVASGPNLLISNSSFNFWDEKILEFEEAGAETSVITDMVYVSGEGIYLSAYKSIVKIDSSDLSLLIPTATIPDTHTLDGIYSQVVAQPERVETPEEIDSIPITLIKAYDYLVYKIHSVSPMIVSSGKYIYSDNTILFESDRNIYLSIIDGTDYYYTKGSKLWFNNDPIISIKTSETILSAIKIVDEILIFTENKYFISSGNSSFNYYVPKAIKILGNKCLLESDESGILISNGTDIFLYNNSELGIYEYIQKIDGIELIKTTSSGTFIQGSNNYLFKNKKNNVIYKDDIYHNGYKHGNFYNTKLGIAPFDYCTNILLNKNVQKRDYIALLKPDFESYFKQLTTLLPKVIADKISERLKAVNIEALNDYPSQTQVNILNTIKEEVRKKVIALLKQIMSETFSIGTDEYEQFSNELYNRLTLPNRNNITQEFYGLAFIMTEALINNTINILNGIDLYALAINYYNRHKEEWADSIISLIKESRVNIDSYKYLLDLARSTELDCYSEQKFLLNYYVIENINSITTGKTGEISAEDKISLAAILPSKENILIENMSSYSEWETHIKEIINTVYKPTQQVLFEDIVNNSSMDPIQWQELPDSIDRTRFSTILNTILRAKKDSILNHINTLVGLGSIPCFSCITDESALIELKNKINNILLIMKSSAQRKIKKAETYETVPIGFTVYNNFGSYEYLPSILNRQSMIYIEYLSQAIDIEINEVGI